MRILVVEDEPSAAAVLSKGLREHAYAVDVAADANDALEQIGVNDYDLVILDVLLPGMDGLALCRQIRSEGLAVPILMLTARAASTSASKDLTRGRTTTSPSRITFPNCWPACARCCAAARRSRPPS